MIPTFSSILPVKLTNGNTGRTKHFGASHSFRKKVALVIPKRRPYGYPVRMVVTRLLGPRERLWDNSSIGRGNYKEIEDAMVERGWFHDDSPKWITDVHFKQDGSDRSQGPALKIEIRED